MIGLAAAQNITRLIQNCTKILWWCVDKIPVAEQYCNCLSLIMRFRLNPEKPETQGFEIYTYSFNGYLDMKYTAQRILNSGLYGRFSYIGTVADNIKSNELELHGWEREEMLERYFKAQDISALVFINEDHMSALVISDCPNDKLSAIWSVFPRYFPYLFEGDNRLTDIEKDMLHYVRDQELERLENLTYEYAAPFITAWFDKKIKNYNLFNDEQRVDSIKEEIRQQKAHIQSYKGYIKNHLAAIRKYEHELFGIQNSNCVSDKQTELIEYLSNNQAVVVTNITSDTIDFEVYAYLDNFDDQGMTEIRDNFHNDIYHNTPFKQDQLSTLLSGMIDNEFKIKTCAAFSFSGGDVRGVEGYGWDSNTFPNPHIQNYQCLGTYEEQITDALIQMDFLMAIELCISSTAMLNVYDSTVSASFAELLYDYKDNRILKLKDGTEVTPMEYLERKMINGETD